MRNYKSVVMCERVPLAQRNSEPIQLPYLGVRVLPRSTRSSGARCRATRHQAA